VISAISAIKDLGRQLVMARTPSPAAETGALPGIRIVIESATIVAILGSSRCGDRSPELRWDSGHYSPGTPRQPRMRSGLQQKVINRPYVSAICCAVRAGPDHPAPLFDSRGPDFIYHKLLVSHDT
jgi:hypothetical protein